MLRTAFVNTDDKPRKINRLGLFKCSKIGDRKYFYEMCEVYYPHPDAPDDGSVMIFDWIEVNINPGTESIIELTINAMSSIDNITNLSSPQLSSVVR